MVDMFVRFSRVEVYCESVLSIDLELDGFG